MSREKKVKAGSFFFVLLSPLMSLPVVEKLHSVAQHFHALLAEVHQVRRDLASLLEELPERPFCWKAALRQENSPEDFVFQEGCGDLVLRVCSRADEPHVVWRTSLDTYFEQWKRLPGPTFSTTIKCRSSLLQLQLKRSQPDTYLVEWAELQVERALLKEGLFSNAFIGIFPAIQPNAWAEMKWTTLATLEHSTRELLSNLNDFRQGYDIYNQSIVDTPFLVPEKKSK